MLKRSNIALAALLLAQLVVLAVSTLLTGGRESRAVQPALEDMEVADIERVMIADDLDNEMIFARGDEGWVLPESDDFPLNSQKIDDALAALAALDTRRLVATNPANFARLEVKEDDFRRRIDLEANADSLTLYLGGSGGVDTVYFRRAEENEVYLGSGLNSWELSTQVSTWLDANYVDVPLDDVLEITVRNNAGSFTFQRDGESWRYAGLGEGEAFEDTKMPILLRNAAGIRMQAPLGLAQLDEYGLDAPQALVEVRYRQLVEKDESEEADEIDADDEAAEGEPIDYDEKSYTLTFGAELDGDIVLKSSDADFVVLVRDSVLNAFKDLTRDDLVKAPEPEAEPASE